MRDLVVMALLGAALLNLGLAAVCAAFRARQSWRDRSPQRAWRNSLAALRRFVAVRSPDVMIPEEAK